MPKDDDYEDLRIEEEDRRTQHEFVRKAVGIVAIQFTVTGGIVSFFVFVDEVKFFALDPANKWIPIACGVILGLGALALGCSEKVRRMYPINIVLLGVFTLVKSISLGFLVAPKYPLHVIFALGLTAVLCSVLILFSLQTKYDFTGILPYLIIAIAMFLLTSIVGLFFSDRIFLIILSSIGVILFSIYLIVDIQLMLLGKHRHNFDRQDYVVAALSIYIDIINIFVYILNLVGLKWAD